MRHTKINRSVLVGIIILFQLVLLSGVSLTAYEIGFRRGGGAPEADKNVNLSNFWQAWDILNQNFYYGTNTAKQVDGAISGMVSGLGDPYTVYLPPSVSNVFTTNLQGSFGGIGAELEIDNGSLTVVAPLAGTPAEKAGLIAGDIITKINGKDVSNMTFDDAIVAIRGTNGTVVTLTIVRKGHTDPFDVPITRDTVTVKSVTTDLIGANKDIAYIKINQFGDDTTDLLKTALQDAATNNRKGIIIDLRNNPGGLLTAAVASIGMVLPQTITSTDADLSQRVAVHEKDRNGGITTQDATAAPIVPTIPMVVLVNAGSASASEIFSGAMKDYGRAKLVGDKTFGKGSVQQLEDLSNGGSIKVTIAHWLTPKGTDINGKGIEPDDAVSLPVDQQPTETDAQVQEALKDLGTN